MAISTIQLADALFQMITEQPKEQKKIVAGFLSYMEEKRLLGLLDGVVRHLKTRQEAAEATTQIKLTVAHKPSTAVINEIRKHIGAPDAEISVVIDESIVGGFQAEYQYTIYDGSVSYQLQQAKKVLLGK